jgi:hypothetical protein
MVFYKKNKNSTFLQELESVLDISGAQNYVPLYSRFFVLNATNWNSINLENDYELATIQQGDYNTATGTLLNNTTIPIFLKYSPLLDPLKYLNGKYSSYDFTLPSLSPSFPKLAEVNNSAYTDSFFSYLSSQLLTKENFIHGIGFHGSYLGIKRKFKYNIEDEIEQLHNSTFFYENNNTLFTLNKELNNGSSSQRNRQKLVLEDESIPLIFDDLDCSFESKNESKNENTECIECPECTHCIEIKDISENIVASGEESEDKEYDADSKSSDSSSQSSNTETEYTDELESSEEDFDTYGLTAEINQFPVQIIALEKCKDTLDSLLVECISPEEITSALMQVIMTLIVYQKKFQFTHNDLHTNNIMYVDTDEEYVYYTHNNIHYKVPTFGRIYKIIDFGRAIYTFEGKQFVSDSFHTDGDAATQYNMEPFLDASKPVLEPNYSFDLCRLACSMLDIIPDDTPVYELVEEWCLDDKKRNVLYKKNGEERYPDFKLYKMIARTVHAHTPEAQLTKPIFKAYVTKKAHPRAIQI